MTKDDEQFILQNMQQHYVENIGNRLTNALLHGLMAVQTIIMQERMEKPAVQPDGTAEPTNDVQPTTDAPNAPK